MKIRCLLLPLDGSDLAENALPAGVYFARLFGASITLFHVIEQGAPARVHASRHLTGVEEAETYLEDACSRYIPDGVSVERHVHALAARDVALSIVEHSAELKPDLIILCAHGSGGPRDWLIGNIAQQVISRGSTPVLLLRPARPPQPGSAFSCRSILLPMDGVPEHERSAELAEVIALGAAPRSIWQWSFPRRKHSAANGRPPVGCCRSRRRQPWIWTRRAPGSTLRDSATGCKRMV
jgi:nucleotide-binding universal stress UspA family protein